MVSAHVRVCFCACGHMCVHVSMCVCVCVCVCVECKGLAVVPQSGVSFHISNVGISVVITHERNKLSMQTNDDLILLIPS